MVLLLVAGGLVGLRFAWDEVIFSANWAREFFSATAAVSTISAIIFRVVSAERRFHSNQKNNSIRSLISRATVITMSHGTRA